MEINTAVLTDTNAIYSVEALLQRAGIISQQKIFERFNAPVLVKGTVTKIGRYQSVNFITLKDREHVITVKCDARQPVHEQQHVVAHGVLLVKPSTFYSGLECYIDGNIVGSWELTEPITEQAPVLEKSRFVSLEKLLEETPLSTIMLLGTQTGIADVMSQLDASTAQSLRSHRIRVASSELLLNDIQEALPKEIKAIFIVRGGDDRTMEVWNDPYVISHMLRLGIPFYTALGHSHSRTLADQYADGSYPTPSILGSSLRDFVSRQHAIKEVFNESQRLRQEIIRLETTKASGPDKSSKHFSPTAIAIMLTVYTMAVILIVKTMS